jgi:hypothetical protein
MTLDEALFVTRGHENAALFLVDYVKYCHLLDDIVDQDKPVTDVRLVEESLNVLSHFAGNLWVMQHYPHLHPLVISGFNAWLDANKMASSTDERIRLSSDVVKGIYHEVVYYVAFLCGGFAHMRVVSAKREYDYDQTKEEKI